jgi:Cu(I)/Ag(I) efflux system membrane fusion protein
MTSAPAGVRTMAIVRWAIVALAAAAAVIALMGGIHRGGQTSSAVQLYYCPMHPAVVQDHPGECPICSMTLVPKPQSQQAPAPAEAPAHPVPGLTGVDLTPERIQLIGMRTAVVKRESVGGDLRTVGVVGPSERGLAQITTRFSGWVEKLMVTSTGERVRRGQVLATLYSPEVLKAQQELLVTKGWNEPQGKGLADHESAAGGLADSARQRLLLLGISAPEIDEVLRSGKATTAIAIRSPSDGYVVGRNVVVGSTVQAGTVLFDVADLGTVWVNADVYEQDLARVSVGQAARFELPAFPGQPHTGRVSFVAPVLDPQNRTLRVRVELKNRFDRSGPRLRPGMYGSVYLALPPTSGLMVPTEAVVDTGELHYLFVSRAGGHFEPRKVELGGQRDGKVEVTSGVSEGETIVTTGNFLIDSESRLRSAIEGQSAAEGATTGAAASGCAKDFDARKYPDKFQACRACEIQHRGMGSMEDDCKNAIPKPWR